MNNNAMHSYHIFYFPFKWEINGRENMLFADQTNLDTIVWNKYTNWLENPIIADEQELNELYNEKNYYYEFVHPVLYDNGEKNSILKHFERKEPQQRDVSYIISKKNGKTYTLKVEAMNLNLYATGVGMLTFYLMNDRDDQKEPEDILTINQYGRRIFPPFIADLKYRGEIAEFISIEGLNGDASDYHEDFSGYTNKEPWKPACFINRLITDLYDQLKITPVIDDRMFVNCWYGNNDLSEKAKHDYKHFIGQEEDYWWYRFVFVDKRWPTCQNEAMIADLIEKSTYRRWQKYGTLYGMSRYSLVALTDSDSWESKELIPTHMRTIYSRMIELVLIQRASILKFSEEVTKVSRLSKDGENGTYIIRRIASLYQEYIRFVNQVHFREVTAQEQGIELYKIMLETLDIKDQIKDLDNELEELHQYASFVKDRERNRKADLLNLVAAIFLPATLFAGIFGMNSVDKGELLPSFGIQIGIVVGATIIMYFVIRLINKRKSLWKGSEKISKKK